MNEIQRKVTRDCLIELLQERDWDVCEEVKNIMVEQINRRESSITSAIRSLFNEDLSLYELKMKEPTWRY